MSLFDLTSLWGLLYTVNMTNTMNTATLADEAADTIRNAEFRQCWPIEVRKALVKAAKTTGDFPPFAVRTTERALRTAQAIEKRLARDIEVGERNLTQQQRRKLGKV